MSLLLALFAVAAPGVSAEGALLEHFDKQCAALNSMDAIEQRATTSGWAKFEPKADSVVGKQANFYAEIAAESNVQIDTRMFSRDDNASLALLVSEIRDSKGEGSIECHVLDTTMKAVDGRIIEQWAKRKPTSKSTSKTGTIWSWQPALNTAATFTAVTFTKEAAKDPTMFPGVGLDAVAVKFFP
jgi:hypothetical protein